MKRSVYLSQCMIVRNEEKNIRRALSWARRIAFEQIVVDTGSTDRTVEIARSMGAKVYHFDWIDDFAAAKNYAIERTSGNWVAFLDADEYMERQDVPGLLPLLERIEYSNRKGEDISVLRQPWLQLDDEGKVFASSVQDRIFRKTSWLRYENSIHEVLHSTSKEHTIEAYKADMALPIYHTGYTKEAYASTRKAERNIALIRRELEKKPDSGTMWSYLGDSCLAAGQIEEAEEAWKKALMQEEGSLSYERKMKAASSLLRLYVILNRDEQTIKELYERYSKEEKETADLEYWMGTYCLSKGRYEEAARHLTAALSRLEQDDSTGLFYCAGQIEEIYADLIRCYLSCKRLPDAVRCATLTLKAKKRQEEVLVTLIRLFAQAGEKTEAVFGFLEKLYEFRNRADALFVLKCARLAGDERLSSRIINEMTPEEREGLNEIQSLRDRWETCRKHFPGFVCRNHVDLQFLRTCLWLEEQGQAGAFARMREKLEEMKQEREANYTNYCGVYNRLPFWGRLRPEEEEWSALQSRSAYLAENQKELLWLYGRLGDYRSRRTLNAILANWIDLDHREPLKVKEAENAFFDPDLIPDNRNAVFVDAGAFTGDTVRGYLQAYGEGYRRIYCYESSPEAAERLKESTDGLERITVRAAGLGAQEGWGTSVSCEAGAALTTLQLCGEDAGAEAPQSDGKQVRIPVVTLDDEIVEGITFLKVHVCGMEKEVIRGAEEQIRENHPVIAAAASYRYEDLTGIARLIEDICPGYTFYLRHYGENLIMADFVLYAIYEGEKRDVSE